MACRFAGVACPAGRTAGRPPPASGDNAGMHTVVIGGGAIGAACALFLRQRGGAAVEVTLVEPDPALGFASSARSAASIRQQFSNPVNVALSAFGFQCLSQPHWLAVDGEVPALQLTRGAYLFLATTPAGAEVLADYRAVQHGAGAAVQGLAPGALAERMPWLRTDDLLAANLGGDGEGWFDGYALARALAAKARSLGARPCTAQVVGGDWHPPATPGGARRLAAVRLDDGRRLEADAFVLAAGAWSGRVGQALGLPAALPVPVVGRKRTVFVLRCPTPLPRTPLVADPSGVWFRSEGNGFIGGWSPGEGDPDPDDLPLDQPDLQQFEDRVWPALAHRVPAFEALRVERAWDGWYEVHPRDHNGLVGPHPAAPNLVLACGFSGHGLQHAPGVGRGVAEWLLDGRYTSIDLAPLGAERIATGRALVEQAII